MPLLKIPNYTELEPFGYSQDGWRIDYRMGRDVDGVLVIRELQIRPDHSSAVLRIPRGGITQLGVLRRLQLEESRRTGTRSRNAVN